MFQNFYDMKPFTTYWYYTETEKASCQYCGDTYKHYIMRYRIYHSQRFPLFPVSTTYYSICSSCSYRKQIRDSQEIERLMIELESTKPVKYNKYSQLDFDDYLEDELMVFGSNKELNKNIKLHLRDMISRGLASIGVNDN